MKYQGHTNKTGKPVEWWVDLSCISVMAMTPDEAEEKALKYIKDNGVEICEISLVELQEKEA